MRQIICILMLVLSTVCCAQVSTYIYKENIASLRICSLDDKRNSRPILVLDASQEMNTDQILEISFDELSHSKHNYQYCVLHHNADWSGSSLMSSEYLDGFEWADIDDYDFSVNTQQLYTHYQFTFPNDYMKPLISGNYSILVYEDGDREDKVCETRFCVVDPNASVSGKVISHTDIELNGRYQQLEFDVEVEQNSGRSISDEYFVVVQQNNRYDNLVYAPRPSFISENKLRYVNHRDLIFEGGNEYRHFDLAGIYFKGYNVDQIVFDHNYYHAFLFADEIRSKGTYISDMDGDGKFLINAERTDDDDYEAEYMYVHFFLPSKQFLDGSVYVLGDGWNNEINSSTRMKYDVEHGCYTYTSYLKQGAYDYLYVMYNPYRQLSSVNGATSTRMDGSFWQTRNNYVVYVYRHVFGARYDELVGITELQNM